MMLMVTSTSANPRTLAAAPVTICSRLSIGYKMVFAALAFTNKADLFISIMPSTYRLVASCNIVTPTMFFLGLRVRGIRVDDYPLSSTFSNFPIAYYFPVNVMVSVTAQNSKVLPVVSVKVLCLESRTVWFISR